VDVAFAADGRIVAKPAAGPAGTRPGTVDGAGSTTRATVLAMLDGYLEVSAAVLDGELELIGALDDVARIGQAIEILLDGAVRAPALQALARDFRDDPCRPAIPVRAGGPARRRTTFYPDAPPPDELALFARLDLLP
jgi:hypothetical protein